MLTSFYLFFFFSVFQSSSYNLAIVVYSTSLKSENIHKSCWNFLNLFPEQKAQILQCPVKNQIPDQSGITCPSHVSLAPHILSPFGHSKNLTVPAPKQWNTPSDLSRSFFTLFFWTQMLWNLRSFLAGTLAVLNMFPYVDIGIKFCEVMGKKSSHNKIYIAFLTKIKIDFALWEFGHHLNCIL